MHPRSPALVRLIGVAALGALLLVPRVASAQLVMDGEVPDDGSYYLLLPFDVPEGTVEIEVRHDDLSDQNILDWGLRDPNGFRGWGGGNTEPAIVGVDAASRSYLPGPIPAGQWTLEIGKAKIVDPPARYHVEIDFRTTTIAPSSSSRVRPTRWSSSPPATP